MDYKYINQLLERYWKGETSLEEEKILRTFFSQDDVPEDLLKFKDLFAYEQIQKKEEVLGEEFERRLEAIIDNDETSKTRVYSLTARLKPLFKAAAIVAIVLTLGNAAQVSLNREPEVIGIQGNNVTTIGASVALNDSASIDSVRHGKLQATSDNAGPVDNAGTVFIK